MYNGFTFKRTKKLQEIEEQKVKPLKERDPDKAAKRTRELSLKARFRKEKWINTLNIDDEKFTCKSTNLI